MPSEDRRAERLHYHMYDSCEGIREHAERIVALEELCADMWSVATEKGRLSFANRIELAERMKALGIEVRHD